MSEERSGGGELDGATVAIVGLGVLGGSLGLALAGRCARRIGTDLDAGAAQRALERGAVDELAPDAEQAVAEADIVVLAMPVGAIVGELPAIAAAAPAGALVTDVGSTKRVVCDAMDQLPDSVVAVGGHPMCGRAGGGIEAATADLFAGARWVLVESGRSTDQAIATLEQLARAVGAKPVRMDRELHDRAAAHASHLVAVVAHALVRQLDTADAQTGGAASQLAAGAMRDATRLAHGDTTMWRDALVTNADHVHGALAALRDELDTLDEALFDPAALERLLTR